MKGCVLLQHLDVAAFKLRQMAVDPALQRSGVGTQLVNAADLYAVQEGKEKIVLHARETAVPFYTKLGYEVTGLPFTEVGIPHLRMEKFLV